MEFAKVCPLVPLTKLRAIDPRSQVKGYVLQNNRWYNAVTLPQATSINQQYLEWTHCRPLIFEAGNIYMCARSMGSEPDGMTPEAMKEVQTYSTFLRLVHANA